MQLRYLALLAAITIAVIAFILWPNPNAPDMGPLPVSTATR